MGTRTSHFLVLLFRLDERLILYGRTGVPDPPSGGRTPLRYLSEESGSFDLSESSTTQYPVTLAPRVRPAGPILQMSLDPGMLTDRTSDAVKLQNEEGRNSSENKKRWGARRQMTFDQSTITVHNAESTDANGYMKTSPEPSVVKSSSTDQKPSSRSGFSTPYSVSDINVDLLGISFVNPSKSVTSLNNAPSHHHHHHHQSHHRKTGNTDEIDLSTPYNHYRCLSPNDSRNNNTPSRPLGNSSRFLKRQFSVDRGDDSASAEVVKAVPIGGARLFKQNSAGAAHDLERIEEIPSRTNCYKHRRELAPCTSLSVSAESLN